MNRQQIQYCRIILITSLFWVLVDAFVILYLTDCSSYRQQPCEHQAHSLNKKESSNDAVKVPELHYDDELKIKNNRLHNVHKQKSKPKTYREHDPAREIDASPKGNDRSNFLNKIKQWFKEDSVFEPVNPSSWPGENGHAVVVPEHLKKEADRRFKENQFNIVASELMALNRSIPDQRSEAYDLVLFVNFRLTIFKIYDFQVSKPRIQN
jgi:polypeptide N-acetylgalactosaminyltransferase